MAISNGTCVSFCNQPKAQFAQFGYLRRVTPVCRCLHPFCGWRYLATSRESKTHFGLPGYAPGKIAVNVTWMDRAYRSNASQHVPIYLQSITSYSEILTYANVNLHLTPPLGVFPLEFRQKVWTSEN